MMAARLVSSIGLILGAVAASTCAAQSVNDQYSSALANQCAAMNFVRDSEGQMLPGQAVGGLASICNEPSLQFSSAGWVDPMQLSGPPFAKRVTALPAWREQTLRPRRGQNESADATDWRAMAVIRPALAIFNGDTFEEDATDTQFGAGIGGTHWLNGSMLIGATGGIRENGYAIAGSFVWTPSEHSFLEVIATGDRVEQKSRRYISQTPLGSEVRPWDYSELRTKTDLEMLGVEVAAGYERAFGPLEIGPRLGIAFRQADADTVRETDFRGGTAGAGLLVFDGGDLQSLVHAVGIHIASRGRRTQASLEILWHHEYLDVNRRMNARFADDIRPEPTVLSFSTERTARDFVSGSFGISIPIASRVDVFTTGQWIYSDLVTSVSGYVGARIKL